MDLNYADEVRQITSLVVDNVDTEFAVERESDDGGLHYVIYLPKDTCTKILRSVLDNETLSRPYIIMLVNPEYILEVLH